MVANQPSKDFAGLEYLVMFVPESVHMGFSQLDSAPVGPFDRLPGEIPVTPPAQGHSIIGRPSRRFGSPAINMGALDTLGRSAVAALIAVTLPDSQTKPLILALDLSCLGSLAPAQCTISILVLASSTVLSYCNWTACFIARCRVYMAAMRSFSGM